MGYIERSYEREIKHLKALIVKADKVVREVRHVHLNGGNLDSARLAVESYSKLKNGK